MGTKGEGRRSEGLGFELGRCLKLVGLLPLLAGNDPTTAPLAPAEPGNLKVCAELDKAGYCVLLVDSGGSAVAGPGYPVRAH